MNMISYLFFQTGALDLITTSRDILRQDLRGVFSFRHLSCQLEEIQSVIGRMLLGDFKTYISTEINKDVVQAKVSQSNIYYTLKEMEYLVDLIARGGD